MRNKLKSRKGATLAELVIVLAVVVIAAGMVVSFSSMMHGAQGISNARHEALQDVRVAEALIESFIENNADAENVGFDDNGALTFNKENGKTAKLSFYNSNVVKIINIINEDETSAQLQIENIESITFEMVDSAGNVCKQKGDADINLDNDTLYYCTVNYSVADAPHSYTYTFCVNPYAGEGGN